MNADVLLPLLSLSFIGLAALVSTRALFTNAAAPLKILSRLWLAMFGVEIVGHFTRHEQEENYWLYNCFHFFFYPWLAYIFSHVLENRKIQTAISVFYWVFILFVICNTLFIQGFMAWQTLTHVVGGCFIIFLGGAYFFQLLNSMDNERITTDPFFWVSFGLVLYFGGSVPFLGMFNYVKNNFFDFASFYFTYVYNAFSIILNLIIVRAFLCKMDYPKSY